MTVYGLLTPLAKGSNRITISTKRGIYMSPEQLTAMRNAGFNKKNSSVNLSKSIVKKIVSAAHTRQIILPAQIECVVGSRESVRRNTRTGATCCLMCPQAQGHTDITSSSNKANSCPT